MSKIVLEDFNEGDGYYKINLAYLNKEQIKEIEALVSKWNPVEESEDERIRKLCKELIESSFINELCNKEERDACINWMEKQGEQKPKKVSIWKHWKDGIAGNGEGKQTYLIKNGLTYSISSCLGHECDYIELSELDKLLQEEKQGNKPKWTEEDSLMIDSIIDTIKWLKGKGATDMKIDWLKSLKQRMEEQQ